MVGFRRERKTGPKHCCLMTGCTNGSPRPKCPITARASSPSSLPRMHLGNKQPARDNRQTVAGWPVALLAPCSPSAQIRAADQRRQWTFMRFGRQLMGIRPKLACLVQNYSVTPFLALSRTLSIISCTFFACIYRKQARVTILELSEQKRLMEEGLSGMEQRLNLSIAALSGLNKQSDRK